MLAKACLCALVAVAGGLPATAATYANARFGYTVSYPEDLLEPKPEAANGDGRAFRSRDGRASFAVFAAAEDAPREVARSAAEVCRGTRPALLLVKPRLVAVSCIHDGLIYYAKVLLGHGTQTRLIAAYPLEERATWDRVTTRMADTLRPAAR